MSMRLSRLELSPASRLRLDVFSESCPSANGRTQINESVRKLIRIQVFYRAKQLAGWMLRPDSCRRKKTGRPQGAAWFGEILRGGGKLTWTTADYCLPSARALCSAPAQERYRWCSSSSELPRGDSSSALQRSCSTRPA